MFLHYLEPIIEFLVFLFEVVGVAIVTWAGCSAIYSFIKYEIFTDREHREQFLEGLRVKFGQKILISLEFFVASDLIRLVISPTYEALGQLAGFVVIRTVLSYFLNMEIREIKEKHWKDEDIEQTELNKPLKEMGKSE